MKDKEKKTNFLSAGQIVLKEDLGFNYSTLVERKFRDDTEIIDFADDCSEFPEDIVEKYGEIEKGDGMAGREWGGIIRKHKDEILGYKG